MDVSKVFKYTGAKSALVLTLLAGSAYFVEPRAALIAVSIAWAFIFAEMWTKAIYWWCALQVGGTHEPYVDSPVSYSIMLGYVNPHKGTKRCSGAKDALMVAVIMSSALLFAWSGHIVTAAAYFVVAFWSGFMTETAIGVHKQITKESVK